jgi:hypothetical protein
MREMHVASNVSRQVGNIRKPCPEPAVVRGDGRQLKERQEVRKVERCHRGYAVEARGVLPRTRVRHRAGCAPG